MRKERSKGLRICWQSGLNTRVDGGRWAHVFGMVQDQLKRPDGRKLLALGAPFMRDVPYSWNTMVDNLCAARCPCADSCWLVNNKRSSVD